MKELNMITPLLQLEFLNTIKTQMNAPCNSLPAHRMHLHLIYDCSTASAPPAEHAAFRALRKQDARDLSVC